MRPFSEGWEQRGILKAEAAPRREPSGQRPDGRGSRLRTAAGPSLLRTSGTRALQSLQRNFHASPGAEDTEQSQATLQVRGTESTQSPLFIYV